jgi:hypothetical protein
MARHCSVEFSRTAFSRILRCSGTRLSSQLFLDMSLSTRYFGQQNESTKKAEPEPGFENTQNLSKKQNHFRYHNKKPAKFGQQ